MKIVITGGGGFLGHRLATTLADRGFLVDLHGHEARIQGITCFDQGFPERRDARLHYVQGNVTDRAAIAAALAPDTDLVFHFAAVVSGGAEADFDLGMAVNLDGTRNLLEACRALAAPPRLIFTSSVAAFGGNLPAIVEDSTTPNPRSSYGVQKVIGEYLVTDYTRKGFIDGRSLRLPTIVIRPGKPNLAASSFASGILREPLAGLPALCPVPETTGMWILSPDRAVEAFLHAATLPSSAWGMERVVNVPGITVTVREMLDALAKVAGDTVASLVRFDHDERIDAIVRTWPVRFAAQRGHALGFRPDESLAAIIRQHIADMRRVSSPATP